MEPTTQPQDAPQAVAQPQRRYLTVTEVAEALRISRGLAYRAVRRGDIPCVRVGHLVRVPAAWLEAQQPQPNAAAAPAP